MLDYDEEILLEQYITYNNMSKTTRDMCMHLISNIKEVTDSEVVISGNNQRSYSIVSMNFNSDGYVIKFNGFLTNEDENRFIDGTIVRKANNYYVNTNIYRLDEFLDDEDRDYSTHEVFTIKDDKILRKTLYKPAIGYFEEELPLFDDIQLYNYYYQKIGKNDKKITL
ncbi:MAG: hypothetical protein ACI33S_01040 [Bacilli bacterium]